MKKIFVNLLILAIAGLVTISCHNPNKTIQTEHTQTDLSFENLRKDKAAVEAGDYKIPVFNQTSQETKTAWIQAKVNELIKHGTTAVVSFSDGKYTVSLTNGKAKDSVVINVSELTERLKETGVKAIMVKDITAQADATDPMKYVAGVPSSIAISSITGSDIKVTPKDSNATVSTPTTTDNGVTWAFTVTAEDTSVTANYTLKVMQSDKIIITEITGGTANYSTGEKVPWVSFAIKGYNITDANKTKVSCKVTKDGVDCSDVKIDAVKFFDYTAAGLGVFYQIKITFPKNTTASPIEYKVLFSADGGSTFDNEKTVIVENKGGKEILPPKP